MAAILNVWIAKPGDPCYVDDHAWTVHVFDSEGQVYRWATKEYGNLPAPQAHWADTIPPGCYVVQASGKDAAGKPVQTDHAIVEVGCEGLVCVRLFVAGSKDQEPHPKECEIKITDVVGAEATEVPSIQVNGTAVNCSQVEVTVSCRTDRVAKTVVSVSGGYWTAILDTRKLRCKCGRRVKVTAVCKDDPNCVAVFESENLPCKPSDTRDNPR